MKFLARYQSSLLTIVDQAIVSGGSFLFLLIVGRKLGIHEFGSFSVILTIVLLNTGIHMSLVTQPLLSLLPQLPKAYHNSWIRQSAILGLILSACCGAIICSLAFLFTEHAWYTTILPMFVIMLSTNVQDLFRKSAHANGRIGQSILNDLLYWSALLLGAILSDLNVATDALLFMAFTSAIVGLLSVGTLVIRRRPKAVPVQLVVRKYWNFGRWNSTTQIIQWVAGNLLILGGAYWIGTTAAGIIRICQNAFGVVHVLLQAAELILLPRASVILSSNGRLAFNQYIRSISSYSWLLAVMLSIAISMGSPYILRILYGDAFVAYAKYLSLYSILYVFVVPAVIKRFEVILTGQSRILLEGYLLSLLLNLLSASLLCHHWGIYGVIAGLILSQVIMLLYYELRLKQIFSRMLKMI